MSLWEIEVTLNDYRATRLNVSGTWQEAHAWFRAYAETMKKELASFPADWWEGYATRDGVEHTLDDEDYETITYSDGPRIKRAIILSRECPRIADIDLKAIDLSL